MLFNISAYAEDIDFLTKVQTTGTGTPTGEEQRLIVVAKFLKADLDSRGGSFAINVTLIETEFNNALFNQIVTIREDQTIVRQGNLETGRIILRYDSVLNRVIAKFSRKVEVGETYSLYASVTDSVSNWVASTTVSNGDIEF